MILTKVRRRRGHQVLLMLDDEPGPVLDATVFEESPFRVGSSLTWEEIEQLSEASARRRAKEKAVFLLSKRDYSRRELENKLCREKGRYYADRREAAAVAAQQMESLGYVDDRQYALRLAQNLQEYKYYPRRRVVQTLQEKGITAPLAAEVTETLTTEDTQLALALLHKKYYNKLVSDTDRQKTAAALARYGFSFGDIRCAMSLWDEETHGK